MMALASAGLAQTTFPIPDGSITINSDGTFTGTHHWVGVFPGFPDEVDEAQISGVISPTGVISGSFTGTSTFNVHIGNGVVIQQQEPITGTISGAIGPDGNYTVYWSGSESGSHSGSFPSYKIEIPQGGGPDPVGESGSRASGNEGNSVDSGPTPPPPGPDGGSIGGFGFTYGSGSSKMCGV